MTQSTTLTFEAGYTRLQSIAQRVTSEEVPVAEMCDLFAEGKGLQKALTEYLSEQKGRVEAIERGEGIQAFRIVTPSSGGNTDRAAAMRDADDPFIPALPTDTADFGDFTPPASKPSAGVDDDIPF
jgi:exodeoxyribonuclease VII small subunit